MLQAALRRVDETLERSEALHAEGHEVAAVGLLKYVDLLLARFNLALARAEAGNADWREALSDPDRDAEVEAWGCRPGRSRLDPRLRTRLRALGARPRPHRVRR